MQQKDGITSLSQQCVCESSSNKRQEEYKSVVRDKAEKAEWK